VTSERAAREHDLFAIVEDILASLDTDRRNLSYADVMSRLNGAEIEARRHLHRVLEQLEVVRWQLLGIRQSLPEPPAERVRQADVSDEPDSATELRTTIDCVLEDDLKPALQDLQEALASPGAEAKES
jgi:hypothetical protein